jgi:MFS family permease
MTGLLLMAWAVSIGELWLFGLASVVVGAGNGMFSGPNFSAMMGSVSRAQRSVASGMSTLTRNIGFLIGTSLGALVFGLLLSFAGGRALMIAARTHELQEVVPYDAFVYAFSHALLISAGLLAIALITVLRYPNRVESTEATD